MSRAAVVVNPTKLDDYEAFRKSVVPLLPDARPDDGVLDAVVLIGGGLAGWLAAAADILLRRRRAHGGPRASA